MPNIEEFVIRILNTESIMRPILMSIYSNCILIIEEIFSSYMYIEYNIFTMPII